jgi:hypothetical protein
MVGFRNGVTKEESRLWAHPLVNNRTAVGLISSFVIELSQDKETITNLIRMNQSF